jgi:FkbH-like protein
MHAHHAAIDTQLEISFAELSGWLDERTDRLIELWANLGADGPTFGSPLAGTPEEARDRYLRPLARMLVGALGGSSAHTAQYFDERTRYIDDLPVDADALNEYRGAALRVEAAAIGELLADRASPAAIESSLLAFHETVLDPPSARHRVLFIGDCLFVETRAFLVPLTRRHGYPVDVKQIFFSSRQPMQAVNAAIVDAVRDYSPQLVGVSLFTYEGVPPYAFAWQQAAKPFGGRRALRMVDGLVDLVRETIADIRTVTNAPIAIHVPCGLPLSRARRKLSWLPPHARGQQRFLKLLAERLDELVAGTENTIAVRESEAVQRLGGLRQAASSVFDEPDMADGYAHTQALGPALAHQYDAVIRDYDLLGKAKALLVDFDNTLWNGVMGEGDVVHDLEAQRLLLKLKEAGVLLVALSKNSETSIRWDEMILSKEDFVLHKINWLPKPDNVTAAIRELDIGADTFVLLDDNPVERALVTENVPGVRALDPTDRRTWDTLARWLAFPSTGQTEEARRRTDMYREATERRAAMADAQHDYGEMMRGLGLRSDVRPATADDMPRLLELIQRTNQFNTTTRRYTAAEVAELLESDGMRIYVASLKDRFGDLGVVATALFDTAERTFSSVIMSCRAMGFGVEIALLRTVMDGAGPGDFRGLFVPSSRNAPSADLFARAGFEETEPGVWMLPAAASWPDIPEWLHHS